MHHSTEFIEVNFAVTVSIDLGNGLFQLVTIIVFACVTGRENIKKLISINLAAVVLIKHHEGSLDVGLLKEGGGIHACSKEFSVVD